MLWNEHPPWPWYDNHTITQVYISVHIDRYQCVPYRYVELGQALQEAVRIGHVLALDFLIRAGTPVDTVCILFMYLAGTQLFLR